MSLQEFLPAHTAQIINSLALFLAVAGAWLLLATRRREHLALVRVNSGEGPQPVELPTARVNRFFYQFGFACLSLALVLSWYSTRF